MAYDYDVIIIGGGLAGTALGTSLARGGINVLILERETTFRDRVRGEYTHPWGVTETRLLGIYDLLKQTCGYEVRYRYNHIVGLPPAQRRDLHKTSPHQVGSMHFYHPAMQDIMIDSALKAGARVQHSQATNLIPGSTPVVRVKQADGERTLQAKLVVGADGRNSNCRKWAGFPVQQDPDRMMIAGVLFDNLDAPEDSVNFFINPERSTFSVFTPLGGKRFRSYAGYYQQPGYHRLSGEKAVKDYIAGSISAGAPEEWFAHAEVSGPLASFNCAENWVEDPYRDGVALIGDAAATSDPSFGCGLSLCLRDARVLGENLLTGSDWRKAGRAYAREHDRYFKSLHSQIDLLTRLFYEPGEKAHERRARAFARIIEDPKCLPDIPGVGPEAPAGEEAYRRLFGDD